MKIKMSQLSKGDFNFYSLITELYKIEHPNEFSPVIPLTSSFQEYLTQIGDSIYNRYLTYDYTIIGEWDSVEKCREFLSGIRVLSKQTLLEKIYPFYIMIKNKSSIFDLPKSSTFKEEIEHGKITKITGSDSYTNSGSDETLNYGVNEDAPINSEIDVINTPANKASNKSTYTRGTSTTNDKDLTNVNSGKDIKTVTDDNVNNYIEITKFLDPYKNKIINYMTNLFNYIIDEKNIIW